MPFGGAGILPYTKLNGNLLVLVGQEWGTGYWSDFGGKRETSDGEDIFTTAAREFAEETRGVFNDGICAGDSPTKNTLSSSIDFMLRTLRSEVGVVRVDIKGYALFIAPVPYVDERVFAVIGEDGPRPCTEKRDFAWIPAEKLSSCVETDSGVIHHRQRRHMILAYRLSHALLTIDSSQTFASLNPAVSSSLSVSAPPSPDVGPVPAPVFCNYMDREVSSDGETSGNKLALPSPLQESCTSLFVSFSEWCDAQQREEAGLVSVTDMHRRKRRSGVVEYCCARTGSDTSQRRRTTHAWKIMIEQFSQKMGAGELPTKPAAEDEG